MINISIIIPVYNAEKHLQQCIKSVCTQTIDSIEIILINDGSDDKSSNIIEQNASCDNRIIFINQHNGGVSKARNTGLLKARGKWIYFLDSDDWIEPNYLLNFIRNAEDYDLIIQGFAKEYKNTGTTQNVKFRANQNFKNYEVIEMLQHKKNAHNGYLWHRLFKRSIITEKHLKFVEGCNFAEDGLFFLQYMRYVKKINILGTSGHHYVIHNSSLTSRKYQNDFYLSVADMYYKALTEIKGDAKYKLFCQNYIWQLVFYWIVCQSLHLKYNYLKKSLNSVVGFLHSKDIREPFLAISVLRFISSITSFTIKRRMLALFILIEKKHINISKYLKSIKNG